MKTTLSLSSPRRTSRPANSPAALASTPAALGEQLARLYDLAQHSTHVFASPVGPVATERGSVYLPRFVYFGPHSSDASVRLAFYAGLSRGEGATTLALLNFIERLTTAPALGEQLSLSFFPLVDLDPAGATLGNGWWRQAARSELALLAADVRRREYHGFIRLESGDEDDLTVRLRTTSSSETSPAVDFIGDEDVAPFAVRWEHEPVNAVLDGPLAASAVAAFELTLRFPRRWTLETHQIATTSILSRFVQRYRAFSAYGQNL